MSALSRLLSKYLQAENLKKLMYMFDNRKGDSRYSDQEIIVLVVQAVAQRLKTPAGVQELIAYIEYFSWNEVKENISQLWRQIPENEKDDVYNSLKTKFSPNSFGYENEKLVYMTGNYKAGGAAKTDMQMFNPYCV
jgi:hypothetical protein